MGFFKNLFSNKEKTDSIEISYHIDDKVKCMKCSRKVIINSPPKDTRGKILVSSVDQMLPFAFRCRACNFITCAECALLAYKLHNPREGIPTCPSCGKFSGSGPIFFTEWLDIKNKEG